jgi:hypothetical protein
MDIDLSDVEWNTSKTVEAISELRDVLSEINSKIGRMEQNAESSKIDLSAECLWELKEANRYLRELSIDKPSTLSVIAYIGIWFVIFKVASHFFS